MRDTAELTLALAYLDQLPPVELAETFAHQRRMESRMLVVELAVTVMVALGGLAAEAAGFYLASRGQYLAGGAVMTAATGTLGAKSGAALIAHKRSGSG